MAGTIPLKSHVKRLIETLDGLFEFGPTYFEQWQTSDAWLKCEYERVANRLTLAQISHGLKICQDLADRKRVAPNPEEFFKLCSR